MAVDPPEDPEKAEEKRVVVEPALTPLSPAPTVSESAEIKAVAQKYADLPLQNPDPGVWAVLTAISKKARERPQGMNIILSRDEHYIGRVVQDHSFRIEHIAVSGRHCRIYKRVVTVGDNELVDQPVSVFLKDISMNGTFVNWNKLTKSSCECRLQHGDIISIPGPPHSEGAYAFVFREVSHSVHSSGSVLKRKSEMHLTPENKRVKGIGIGAPDGPISLDDVRSLQRSNMELRKQLESHVLTIENMRTEARISITHHENEIKEMKESISSSYLDQIKELRHMLEAKQKELDDVNAVSAEHQHSIKDLNERLSASMASRAEAGEIINSQKAIISEREAQLDEEKNQRRAEREKAATDLKSALQRAHSEAQEEIKRQADIHLQHHREQQEFIDKLQELEKESRLLVETLRSKLEDTRESLVISEKKVRQLEAQLQEEHATSESNKRRSEMLELEIKRLKKEVETEKVAREEAWAKVSALELETAAVIRELSIEKQRFQGARERIILRETQLRAFYSTTEEISALFAKQQEQLKAMQKTLEDEDNYDNSSMGFDLNVMAKEDDTQALVREGRTSGQPSVNITTKDSRPNPLSKMVQDVDSSSSNDDASVTEKHDCEIGSQDNGNSTQDLECTSADRSMKVVGPEIEDGVGTATVSEDEDDIAETEQVPETESLGAFGGFDQQTVALRKCSDLAGDTMQLEDDAQIQENLGHTGTRNNHHSQSKLEDSEAGMVRTADLLASEGVGSWANNTAPSVYGENDFSGNGANAGVAFTDSAAAVPCNADALAAGSQSNPVVSGTSKLTEQHRALSTMIEIVEPNFKERFPCVGSGTLNDSMSDAETEEGNDHGDDEDDAEGSNSGDDVIIKDSVG